MYSVVIYAGLFDCIAEDELCYACFLPFSRIESDKANLTIKTRCYVCHAVDVTLVALLG